MHTALVFCKLPLQRVPFCKPDAANQCDANTEIAPYLPWSSRTSNVRLLRCPYDPDQTRFALAGKMADVCQALDKLAAQELAFNSRMANL